jgi:uncharacterized protein DUF6790
VLFLLFLVLILGAASLHVALRRPHSEARSVELFFLYLLVGYYGLLMLFAAAIHLTKPDALDAMKGWPSAGRPLHTLYAFALIGVAVASLLGLRLRGTYLLGPAIVGSLLSFGGAYVHIGEIVRRGNLIVRSDGLEIIFDILVPVGVLSLAVAYLSRSRTRATGA